MCLCLRRQIACAETVIGKRIERRHSGGVAPSQDNSTSPALDYIGETL